MLVASDEIGFKPSSRAYCRGHVFITVSKAFLAINLFLNMSTFFLLFEQKEDEW